MQIEHELTIIELDDETSAYITRNRSSSTYIITMTDGTKTVEASYGAMLGNWIVWQEGRDVIWEQISN